MIPTVVTDGRGHGGGEGAVRAAPLRAPRVAAATR
jgi:hypothetical protein